jgi:hypothetical protein
MLFVVGTSFKHYGFFGDFGTVEGHADGGRMLTSASDPNECHCYFLSDPIQTFLSFFGLSSPFFDHHENWLSV